MNWQMKVVGHEAPGVDLPAGFLAGLAQGFQKALAVLVVLENIFAPVAPIHEVVNGAGILDSEFAWHGAENTKKSLTNSFAPLFFVNGLDPPLSRTPRAR